VPGHDGVEALAAAGGGNLAGIRVIELADAQAEYCGLLLAGLGATVVKVEPPGGSPTRRYGPFYGDEPDPDRSLYFWTYNRGKRSVVLDLDADEQRERLLGLLEGADVLLTTRRAGELAQLGLGDATLEERFPSLVTVRVTPFGEDGPWAGMKGSDLVHLALGGQMMNCGYDPQPDGRYDLPPIAPQAWHAYHVAGEQLAVGIAAALVHRARTGRGQVVSMAVHQAVSVNTENDIPEWIFRRAPLSRQTCRHSNEVMSPTPTIAHTKDGRWIMLIHVSAPERVHTARFLAQYGMAAGLDTHEGEAAASFGRQIPGTGTEGEEGAYTMDVWQRFVRKFSFDRFPWREAQAQGLLCVPLLQPHELLADEHWWVRGTFSRVEHPEVGRSFAYPVSKWVSSSSGAWPTLRRAPLVGEDTDDVLGEPARPAIEVRERPAAPAPARLSRRGKPFALDGIRVLDFTWFLASAGATRFLSAFGAECLKVEWRANPDTRVAAMAPVGGRAARRQATSPVRDVVTDPDMGGAFNNKNPGKRGMSLNVRDPRGLDIAKRLVALSDVVAEGFSPGVMDRWGLGYEVLKSIRPDVIYAQQSGMGARGTYGRFRSVGPVAAALAGTAEMSGLPQPAMPAGWGYSYLDWIGAYSFALAIMAALYRREATGEGQWIDCSQTETGIFPNGLAILDWEANGRVYSRSGNRAPFGGAAPHGAYPCRGEDRWIAIACHTEEEWGGLVGFAGDAAWTSMAEFATLDDRLRNQDALDRAISEWTRSFDRYELMQGLQAAGVPAGVCQNAEDRFETDPQLPGLDWLTEVTGTKIGTWPVVEVPVHLSETPSYAGGAIDRGAPCYGEDNEYVLGELLGFSSKEIATLAAENVI
jgi:crotonobetainyl-CoA:carnitine CoA-transferase CaiB-like acyl-CoA transferase